MSMVPTRVPAKLSEERLRKYAVVFSALGDPTRLSILTRLAGGVPQSIARLAESTDISRQAVTKHLQVLEEARLVRGARSGRENLFELNLRPLRDMNEYLNFVSVKWDQSLMRLKNFVERD
jgi:DNA-binding transcriptional ArsR family regulator